MVSECILVSRAAASTEMTVVHFLHQHLTQNMSYQHLATCNIGQRRLYWVEKDNRSLQTHRPEAVCDNRRHQLRIFRAPNVGRALIMHLSSPFMLMLE